jgi:23S rRNA (uracil1939-C5)-methyltransferase
MFKPGQLLPHLTIHGITSEGKAVARHDGLVVFVSDGVPGDVADVEITYTRRRFVEGRIVKLISPSADRSESFCRHFGVCGGCKWQHMSYKAQLRYKQNHVAENLAKISGLDLPEILPIVGSDKTRLYRNKLEFTFSNKRWLTKEEISSGKEFSRNALGFHIPGRFDKVLDLDECHLQGNFSNEVREAVRIYAREQRLTFFDLKEQHGLLRNLIIRTASTGDLMVIVQFFEPDEMQINSLMEYLKVSFPQITSLNYIINQKKNETYHDQEVICFAGKPYIEEEMEGLTFRIGPKSFYQTNSGQAYELYKIAREYAQLTGDELVYDLYTGTGTIANFVARQSKNVIGVEYVPEAIEDARKNSELNGITNTQFFSGDMKDVLNDSFVTTHGRPDVIIVDPPRAGMHEEVVETLSRILPERIVYVSCNPATQARDIALLGANYAVRKIQPVDMFPHTQHVECVVLLERVN